MAISITTAQQKAVSELYVAFFNRAADSEGLGFWAGALASGKSIASVAQDMYLTAPARAYYSTALTNEQFIKAFYATVLNRATPDAEGVAFWTAALNQPSATQGSVAVQIMKAVRDYVDTPSSPTNAAALTAKTLFAAKVDVSTAYALQGGTVAGASTVLTGVVDAATAAAAIANLGAGTIGSTFTLTNGVDNLVGTGGNDTFIAGSQATNATLNAGDTISGGAGNDTLKIFNDAAVSTANFGTATISGVENVEATLAASAQTLNVSGNADVTKVSLVNGFDGVVTAKLAQTAGLSGTINTVGAAATFTFIDNTGAADTANLAVSNAVLLNSAGAGVGVNIAGVETLNIAATGTNVLGNLDIAATTKLVITGAGSLNATLSNVAGLTKTIDGSAATGNLVINNAAAVAAIQSIKTGSGNDIYTTVYAHLTADDAIDLGTGTDSLRFSDSATFNDATTKARLTKVVGVEQLGVSAAAATLTVDADFVSQTSFYVAGAASKAVLTNAANNSDVNFGVTDIAANITGVNTVGMKLGANTLNVNLTGSATGASVVGGVVATAGDGLAVTGSATINVKSTGTSGQPNNILDLTAADNQSVVITGSQNLTLTAKAATGTTGFSIDGSAFTGKLTVTGTAATDIIKGGSGNDIISGGAGAVSDTLTGGAGADKFIIIAGATAATADVITDFVTAVDTISFGAAVLTADVTKGAVVVADFAAALVAANLVLTSAAATQVNVQQVGADSYVFFNDGLATGADMVVKLTGVALAGVVAADIVA